MHMRVNQRNLEHQSNDMVFCHVLASTGIQLCTAQQTPCILFTNSCNGVRYPADSECLRLLHASREDCSFAVFAMHGSTARCAVANVGHAGGINCLDLSPDGRFLVAVGLNSHSKQLVILWNVTGLVDGQKVTQHRRLLLDSSLSFLSDNLSVAFRTA